MSLASSPANPADASQVVGSSGIERRLRFDPFDTDAWLVLQSEASGMVPSRAGAAYRRITAQFPTAGRSWAQCKSRWLAEGGQAGSATDA